MDWGWLLGWIGYANPFPGYANPFTGFAMQMSMDPANMLPPQYDDALPNDYDPSYTADISTKMRVPDRISAGEGMSGSMSSDWAQHSVATMNIPDKIVIRGQEQSIGIKDDPKLHLDLNYHDQAADQQYVGLQTPPRVLTLEDRPFHGAGLEDSEREDTTLEWPSDEKTRHTDSSLPNGYTYPSPHQHSSGLVQNFLDLTGETLSSVMERTFNMTSSKENTPIRRAQPQQPQPSDSLTLEASMSMPGDGLLIQDEQADDIAVLRRQMAKLSRHVMRLEEDNSKRSNRELVLYPLVITYMLYQLGKWFIQIK